MDVVDIEGFRGPALVPRHLGGFAFEEKRQLLLLLSRHLRHGRAKLQDERDHGPGGRIGRGGDGGACHGHTGRSVIPRALHDGRLIWHIITALIVRVREDGRPGRIWSGVYAITPPPHDVRTGAVIAAHGRAGGEASPSARELGGPVGESSYDARGSRDNLAHG